MKVVEAINPGEIGLVTTLLAKHHGQLYVDVWKVGLNLSLRISDLLSLRFDQLDTAERELHLVEQKTQKPKSVRLNATACEIINRRRLDNADHEYLFQVDCNRARGRPISRQSVSRAFQDVGNTLGLNINTHSMRKSRGKAMFDAGIPVEKISKVLNHSDTGVTLRYLGITHKAVMQTYDDFQL
jgi:integrase